MSSFLITETKTMKINKYTQKRSTATAILFFFLAVLVLALACSKHHEKEITTSGQQLYTCPMHPEVISDHPGVCPICKMDLVKKVADDSSKKQLYTCSMHPEVISDHPGVCPICKMDLVKKVAKDSSSMDSTSME
jgi:hypothetical protein